MKLSLVIPAHNEEQRIGKTLESYITYLADKLGKNFEIIVVLNGCKDNTLDVVKKLSKEHAQITFKDFTEPLGKGGAIIEGFKLAKGDFIGFVDADGATTPDVLYTLVLNLKEYDGVIASRWVKGAKILKKESLIRVIVSRGFNLLVRFLFFIPFTDTQCGAKIFKKKVINGVLPELGITQFSFDVDLLFRVHAKGYKVKELPTIWEHKEGSTLNLKKTIPEMFLSIVRLRLLYSPFNFIIKAYDKLPKFLKVGGLLI